MLLRNTLFVLGFLPVMAPTFARPYEARMQERTCPSGMRAGPWHDGALQTLEGRIKDVRVDTGCMGHGSHVSLLITVDGKDSLVLLGPVAFVNSKKVGIALGETVRIKAMPMGDPSEGPFMADEVEIKGKVLKLRDENGRPVWAGRPKIGVS